MAELTLRRDDAGVAPVIVSGESVIFQARSADRKIRLFSESAAMM